MKLIAQMQLKRKAVGKASVFRVRNYPVKPEKIERYMKRNNLSERDLMSLPSPTTGKKFASRYEYTVTDY